jgi:hypothetical protein
MEGNDEMGIQEKLSTLEKTVGVSVKIPGNYTIIIS